MANEMKFRDELLARIIAGSIGEESGPLSVQETRELIEYVDMVAKEACNVWGHDEVEFYLNAPGSMTLAAPAKSHRHYRCRRCGEELKGE